jgi:putative hemolysin
MISFNGAPVVGFGVLGPQDIGGGIANPAAQNCADRGGTIRTVSTPQGQSGMCVFPDGSECQEWALYHGECVPGQKPTEEFKGLFEADAGKQAAIGVLTLVGAVGVGVLIWKVIRS